MTLPEHFIADVLVNAKSGFACGEHDDSGVLQIRMNNIGRDGSLDLSQQRRVPKSEKGITSCKVEKGDVLFNATNSPELVGKTAYFGGYSEIVTFSNHFLRLRPKPESLDGRYLAYWLIERFHAGVFKGLCRQWVNQATVSREALLQLKIPLPPLPEQKRIAEILDGAEALRAKRRAALALLDELTQSIFLDMFGDSEVQGSKWPVQKIAEYVAEFQGGKSLESTDDNSSQRRVLKVSAVTGMKFRPHESKPVDDEYEPPDEHYVRNGDLLFSRANTTELVGAVAYVSNCPRNLLLPDKLWRFVWKDEKSVHPLFIWYLFQTRPVRREIGNRATGTSGSMKNISKEKLFGISTIFPPFELQQEFADCIMAIEQMQVGLKDSLAELDQLFASLQHRAFRGEL